MKDPVAVWFALLPLAYVAVVETAVACKRAIVWFRNRGEPWPKC